jgi:adhesin/invasin
MSNLILRLVGLVALQLSACALDAPSNIVGPGETSAHFMIESGDGQHGIVGASLADAFVVAIEDGNQAPIVDLTVDFAVTDGGGAISTTTLRTDAQGRAQTVLTLGTLAGPNTVRATAAGLTGALPLTFTAQASADVPASIAATVGDQIGTAGAALAQPLGVVVEDRFHNPVAHAGVTFAITAGGGALSVTTIDTDAAGHAASVWTLGPNVGANAVEARVATLPDGHASFAATGFAGTAAQLLIVAGDNSRATAGSTIATPMTVEALDANGNPVPGAIVTFAITAGGGSVSAATVATDMAGVASSTLTLGTQAGTNHVQVTTPGVSAAAVFTATGLVGAPSQIALSSTNNPTGLAGSVLPAPIVVTVTDSHGNADPGCTVSFVVTTGNGSVANASVLTDAQGRAQTAFTFGKAAGANQVTAQVMGASGAPAVFTAEGTVGAPVTLYPGQTTLTASVGSWSPLYASVLDQYGNPVPGIAVRYTVISGPGTLSSASVTTDATGYAMAHVTYGPNPATIIVVAQSAGLASVTYTSTTYPSYPWALAIVSGNDQLGCRGDLGAPLVVSLTDYYGNRLPNYAISFNRCTGTACETSLVTTDAQGQASVQYTFYTSVSQVTASYPSSGAVAPVTFTFTGETCSH